MYNNISAQIAGSHAIIQDDITVHHIKFSDFFKTYSEVCFKTTKQTEREEPITFCSTFCENK